MTGLRRNLYSKVNRLLTMFPVVLITGVRQGGKTTLARMCCPDWDYYRTRNGAEVDLVLSGDFGLLPIEIKYGVKTDTRKLATLKRFIKERDLPLGLVVNNAAKPEHIADRIVQLPATYL